MFKSAIAISATTFPHKSKELLVSIKKAIAFSKREKIFTYKNLNLRTG
jgi:hypothetical protein